MLKCRYAYACMIPPRRATSSRIRLSRDETFKFDYVGIFDSKFETVLESMEIEAIGGLFDDKTGMQNFVTQ
jgi:hypothetical protein